MNPTSPELPSDEAPAGPDSSPLNPDTDLTPEGWLPLLPHRYFGKWGFAIVAVPFLIYLGGTMFGSYLENLRKEEPVHTLRNQSRALASQLDEKLKHEFDVTSGEFTWTPEQSARLRRSIGLEATMDALDDENSDINGIEVRCKNLLEADLTGVPAEFSVPIEGFRKFVAKFIELEKLKEEGEINKIRPRYHEFLAEFNLPVDTGLTKSWYPLTYTCACLASLIAVLVAIPGYLRHPFRVHGLAVQVGVLGIVVWIGLWMLDDRVFRLAHATSAGVRAGFNPFEELKDQSSWMWIFLAIRFLGLVLVVPLAEEFFLRGYLMRFIEDVDWDLIPVGRATWRSLIGIAVYAAMSHPAELIASVAWFGLVTWLFLKTRSIWDCVVAHATTNLLLGIYVVMTGTWELW